MANPNPHKARAAKKRLQIRKTGDLEALRREMWRGVLACREVLMDANTDPATTLKAVHALATVGGAYTKAIEVTELAARMAEIEGRLTGN